MINPFIPATYAIRNADKSLNNADIGRYFVVPGQIKNACLAASAVGLPILADNKFINKEIESLKSGSKFFKGIDSFIDFSAKHTNLLLSAAGVLRMLGADDKKEAAFKETCGLSCMFGAEKLMKNIRKKIGLLNNIKNASLPKKLICLCLDALLQVGTSIVSYNLGAKIGKDFNNLHNQYTQYKKFNQNNFYQQIPQTFMPQIYYPSNINTFI